MDKGAWQATVHGVAESGHDFAFALHSLKRGNDSFKSRNKKHQSLGFSLSTYKKKYEFPFF